ncbi:hypothetical protein HHI36_008530 [Cryptolaemus montrouzieri]|uniref:Uncharacterized protein n=1 Tax=Cryptolaemus montrouzieri TaxID=559131 RepID=A0ABD2MSR4_9CUCU
MCPTLQNLVEDYLQELKRCEQIFKTHSYLEILPPCMEPKSKVDNVKFCKIAELMTKEFELIRKMETKLTVMSKSLEDAGNICKEIAEVIPKIEDLN